MSKQIASTILSQLGGSKIGCMIGVDQFVAIENGLQFRFKAKAKNKSNLIQVKLNDSDLYDITFGYIRGANYSVRSEFSDIYCDQLIEIFEEQTGLFLHF